MLYRTDEILKKYKTNIELEKAIKNKKIFKIDKKVVEIIKNMIYTALK